MYFLILHCVDMLDFHFINFHFRSFGLVPIAAEDYSGYDSATYYAVAVARRTDSFLTIFNLRRKYMSDFSWPIKSTYTFSLCLLATCTYSPVVVFIERRTCHSAVWTAAGWIIPVDKLIETGQIRVQTCNPYFNVGTSL